MSSISIAWHSSARRWAAKPPPFIAAKMPNRMETLTLVGSTGLTVLGAEARLQTSVLLVDMSREAIRARMQRGLRNLALITDELVEEDFRINNSPGAAASFGPSSGRCLNGTAQSADRWAQAEARGRERPSRSRGAAG
jgi:hypothetical protein